MMNNLGNKFARWLNKPRFDVFVWLMRLVDRTRAKNQRWAKRLNKWRFGAVVHDFGLRTQQFLNDLY